jgi:hypothetical protein
MAILRVLVISFAVGGCALTAPPPIAVGPCTLVVLSDNGPTPERLAAPFIVREHRVQPRSGSSEADAQADITFRGTGWQSVHMTLTSPAGDVRSDEDIPGAEINAGGMGTSLDAPGLWRFRLSDSDASCTAEFSVEVDPPTG